MCKRTNQPCHFRSSFFGLFARPAGWLAGSRLCDIFFIKDHSVFWSHMNERRRRLAAEAERGKREGGRSADRKDFTFCVFPPASAINSSESSTPPPTHPPAQLEKTLP